MSVERGIIILVGYTKGGANKSTTVTNLATEFARQGADVVIMDADKQRTCAKWQERREEARENGKSHLPPVHCIEKQGNIKSAMLDAAKRYDVVLVDTAGRDSRELRVALMTADVVLIPAQASQADLEAMEDMAEILSDTQDINPDRKTLAFLTSVTTSTGSKRPGAARSFLNDFPEIEVMRSKVHTREAYKDALRDGVGVIEAGNSKAKAEIQVLAKELMKHV